MRKGSCPGQLPSPRFVQLEPDPVAALQLQHLPRLLRRRDLQRQLLQDAADLRHLLGVDFASLPLPI